MSTNPNEWLLGKSFEADIRDFGAEPDLTDHKLAYVVERCRGRDVLDIGCVNHDPASYQSRYWLHGAIKRVARTVVGLDLYDEGIEYLRARGFDVRNGDAQQFELSQDFDVVVGGDVIEHLANLDGFLCSCLRHLRPGGSIVLSTPNPWYWRFLVKAALFGRVTCNAEHALWLCPVTLAQLSARYGLETTEVEFGSRYLRDRLMPLPKGLRHTSFHATLRRRRT